MTRSATRRAMLHRLAGLALAGGLGACAGLPGSREVRISTAQLEQALQQRMPLRQSLAGIVTLHARVPRLRMLPEQNRIAAEVKFEATGPLLPQAWYGGFDLLFGLQFDPADLSLRARDIELQSLRMPMVMGRSAELLQGALAALANQIAKDVPLHRLDAREAQRLKSFALQPDAIDVTPDGLVLRFVPAPRPGRT